MEPAKQISQTIEWENNIDEKAKKFKLKTLQWAETIKENKLPVGKAPSKIELQQKWYNTPSDHFYIDPKYLPESSESLDALSKDYENLLYRDREQIPTRYPGDIIKSPKGNEK